MNELNSYTTEAIKLLKKMISIPSFSKEELEVADLVYAWLKDNGLNPSRKNNNIWIKDENFDQEKPTILLNSHIDTVKPGEKWTCDPFIPTCENDKITGLGSNDAGASVVSLIQSYLLLRKKHQPYNLILAITAEEEISGTNGFRSILDELGKIDLGVVGEPTQMQMAIAERGLLVLDCYVEGQTGHAARNEGVNAIYKAIPAIEWFKNHPFQESKGLLGPVKMTVTQVDAGKQHNVIPDMCHFVVDVRINESYSNKQLYEEIAKSVDFRVVPRSFHLNSSYISEDHPVVMKGKELGLTTYGSPTTSDQAVMPFTTIKIGPGDSARSHTPDEYILESEIKNSIQTYFLLLNQLDIGAFVTK